MRVLITGGAGFIGSHLADALLAQGDEVTILDNLTTGSTSNIAHIPVQAQSVSNATSMATGDGHTCVLNTSSILKCWGANSYGELGISSNVGTRIGTRV